MGFEFITSVCGPQPAHGGLACLHCGVPSQLPRLQGAVACCFPVGGSCGQRQEDMVTNNLETCICLDIYMAYSGRDLCTSAQADDPSHSGSQGRQGGHSCSGQQPWRGKGLS